MSEQNESSAVQAHVSAVQARESAVQARESAVQARESAVQARESAVQGSIKTPLDIGRSLSVFVLMVAIAALAGSGWLYWQSDVGKQAGSAYIRVGSSDISWKFDLPGGASSDVQYERSELINEDQLNAAEKYHFEQTPLEQNPEWQPVPENILVSDNVFNQTFLPNKYSEQNSSRSDSLFTHCRIEQPQRTRRKSKAESFRVFLGKDQLFAWFVMDELLNRSCTGVSFNKEILKTLNVSETCTSNCHLNPYTDMHKQYYQEVYQQSKSDKVVWLRKSLEILIQANNGRGQEFLKKALEEALLIESIPLRSKARLKTHTVPALQIKPIPELVPESIQMDFARNAPFAVINVTAFETVKASHTLLAGSADWRRNCQQISCAVSSSRWDSMSRRFNEQLDTVEGKKIIQAMTRSFKKMEGLTLEESAQKVHKIMNKLRQREDLKRYKEPEFWATPIEFLTMKRWGSGGDCEDYVIAKYVALRMLGVPKERLQLLAVEHHNYKGNKENYDHAVLVVYTDNDALILDSLRPDALSINHQDILRDYTLKYAIPSRVNPRTQFSADVPMANDKSV